ncbi:MAG: RimK family alpha-L-glutamate ligase [Gammaproteobacteria bacterium]|nr:MAG: RimK family alpha-L-glutamate ligase [Gammaproteobacteria bacterium]
MSKRIALVTDDPGWHGRELHNAFARKGYKCTNVSLTDCYINVSGHEKNKNGSSLFIPGFEGALPDGVFVRGVQGGTLEEVVFYLDVLHALHELKILVYNSARAIERSVDKGMTSFLLDQAGIHTPPTWIGNDVHQAYSFIRRELAMGNKVVAKPLFGSQGKDLQLICKPEDITNFKVYNKIYYLQRFIQTGDESAFDWRIFVIGDRVIASMRREGMDWISNVANGGKCYSAVINDQFAEMAKDAVQAVDMHYAGVDVMQDLDGKLWVTEVNSIPAWKGLESVNNLVVADRLAEDFVNCMQTQADLTVAN